MWTFLTCGGFMILSSPHEAFPVWDFVCPAGTSKSSGFKLGGGVDGGVSIDLSQKGDFLRFLWRCCVIKERYDN
jgi:hypothetical protein